MGLKQIGSTKNPLIRQIRVLQEKSRERKKLGRFVLEGRRELQLALKANYILDTVLIQEDLVSKDVLKHLFSGEGRNDLVSGDGLGELCTSNGPNASATRPEIIGITREVYQKLAYRGTTEGILALAKSKPHSLDDLALTSDTPLILIAEAPEKPGNIGALLRTADAAGLDAVIIADPKTDLYNPNIIRSSVGCVFTNNIATGSTPEVISYLRKNKIPSYCAALTASKNYTETDFSKASAIVVGTEAAGLSREWLESAYQNIIIPMGGEIDSMNVSVSAAILIFEAKRQRGFR
ncbi:MAG TPA: RNA methyltransferase [Pricia sp.]|nr:RNA methyltransferase [Pricia sp.]